MQNDAERQFPKNPQPRRRAKGLVLALASACVIFSVAVIGRTHPPFPAPKVRRRDEATDAPVARHSWLAKQSSADLESEFRDAADETTSLLHRPPSRFRDAAQ